MDAPETEAAYSEGYRAGWLAGYADGKGAGYSDAKTRARLALEAACDHLDLARSKRQVLMRAADSIVGSVQ